MALVIFFQFYYKLWNRKRCYVGDGWWAWAWLMDDTSHVTIQGGLMAARVFDTYMPGGEEPLISFINSISDGRILCLAILVSC